MNMRLIALPCLLASFALAAERDDILRSIDNHAAQYGEVSKQIWQFAELGYHETKSSALLQRQLKDAGFDVQAGIAAADIGRCRPDFDPSAW